MFHIVVYIIYHKTNRKVQKAARVRNKQKLNKHGVVFQIIKQQQTNQKREIERNEEKKIAN